jgi:hypothetical protein
VGRDALIIEIRQAQLPQRNSAKNIRKQAIFTRDCELALAVPIPAAWVSILVTHAARHELWRV